MDQDTLRELAHRILNRPQVYPEWVVSLAEDLEAAQRAVRNRNWRPAPLPYRPLPITDARAHIARTHDL